MSRYLLDTNICIHYLKGQYALQKRISQVGFSTCCLSEITLAELLFGVENSDESRREANRTLVYALQEIFAARVYRIGESFEEYARQKAALKRAGRVVVEFDLLIGATAITHNLILVTRNIRHFEYLQRIKLENWIDH